jgi:hypothetical protein
MGDEVGYEQHLGLGLKLILLLRYDAKRVEVFVNPFYHKFIRNRIEDINPPGGHLTDVLRLKLIENGFIPLHSSAFSHGNEEGVIIFAPSGTGKTTCVLHAVARGCRLISEDISVTDGSQVYGCPLTSTFIDLINPKGLLRPLHMLYKRIPIIRPYLREIFKVSIKDVLKSEKISSIAKIKTVFILEKSKKIVFRSLEDDKAFYKILSLNRNEFPYQNPLLFALQFFDKVDLFYII